MNNFTPSASLPFDPVHRSVCLTEERFEIWCQCAEGRAGADLDTGQTVLRSQQLLVDAPDFIPNHVTGIDGSGQHEEIQSRLEKHLAQVNPSYGDKVKNGLIQPVKLVFSQPETYVLYKEMMLMRGNAIAQLKPVTVIGNEVQKRFFFTLTEDFEEIKALSAR